MVYDGSDRAECFHWPEIMQVDLQRHRIAPLLFASWNSAVQIAVPPNTDSHGSFYSPVPNLDPKHIGSHQRNSQDQVPSRPHADGHVGLDSLVHVRLERLGVVKSRLRHNHDFPCDQPNQLTIDRLQRNKDEDGHHS